MRGVSKKKKLAMVAEHVAAIMELPKPEGVHLLDWALSKAMVILGWWAFLRVSELIGSGHFKDGCRRSREGQRAWMCAT